jgi:hypothetical protein
MTVTCCHREFACSVASREIPNWSRTPPPLPGQGASREAWPSAEAHSALVGVAVAKAAISSNPSTRESIQKPEIGFKNVLAIILPINRRPAAGFLTGHVSAARSDGSPAGYRLLRRRYAADPNRTKPEHAAMHRGGVERALSRNETGLRSTKAL